MDPLASQGVQCNWDPDPNSIGPPDWPGGPMELGSGSQFHWTPWPVRGSNGIGIRIPIALDPLTGQGVHKLN